MTLLVTPEELESRRAVAAGPLAPLARSLANDLAIVRGRTLFVPAEKALLSREGGRCASDGTLLEFNPFEPESHRCSVCGAVYAGELHYRFWIYWYQMWLAERAVHAALLAALDVDRSCAELAASILDAYVDRYDAYPNRDNVLGPSRLFFSTYLESIWLLQICVAVDLLDGSHAELTARVRDRIIEPARGIIARFDEAQSNRQVWNDAALLAAARLLGDAESAEQAVLGPSGVEFHLANGLLADGTWYEGENYHLFAHRGLWYSVVMAERAGLRLDPLLLDRFHRGFRAPFVTALPDLTFPSRRDSQYAVSLRQWRVAEHVELGLAMYDDRTLIGALERLYRQDIPRAESERWRSSADVERNGPPSALTRADLNWRALLHARAELPPLKALPPESALLEAQGIAVFRRSAGRLYAALDYGHSGGGHGHPDRLNVLLVDETRRWLDDAGTGSYVDPTLHWYRSSLAHNAPSFNGLSQLRVDGDLLAYDERDGIGWIVAKADGIAPGATARRTLVVTEDYVVDELTWQAPPGSSLTLPFHADLTFGDGVDALVDAPLQGGERAEDGYVFVHDASVQHAGAGVVTHGIATHPSGSRADLWASSTHAVEWWRAEAPGPPGSPDRSFRVARIVASEGRLTSVWSVNSAVLHVAIGDSTWVSMEDGTVHEHRRTADGWHIDIRSHTLNRSIELGGAIASPAERPAPHEFPPIAREPIRLSRGDLYIAQLGEAHYRASEQTWDEAGRPSAEIRLARQDAFLAITVDVRNSDRTFALGDALNAFDNEHPDVNGDGIQLYVETTSGVAARMLVPERGGGAVRIRPIESGALPLDLTAAWTETESGYRMELALPVAGVRAIDIIVNEKPSGRERRRGQLVMSGAAREFVYLRGDRHEQSRLVPLQFPDA